MNEVVILKKFLTAVTTKMHNVRRASLTSCVSSLLNGAKASVTDMGRGISSSVYETSYQTRSLNRQKNEKNESPSQPTEKQEANWGVGVNLIAIIILG